MAKVENGPFKHPIEGLMETAMESIKAIVNVHTILGDPVEAPDGTVVIPVSRVSLGFAAGGTEYEVEARRGGDGAEGFPFGGGSGAGITVNPVAFLVVGQGQVRLMPINQSAVYDRLIDLVPKLLEHLQGLVRGSRPVADGARVPAAGQADVPY